MYDPLTGKPFIIGTGSIMCELHNKVATPVGQEFVVISVVSPAQGKSDTLAVVVRGVFATIDEARKFAEDHNDGKFDVFIVKAGYWFPLPPNYDRIDDVRYTDERLQMLMDAHLEEQNKCKKVIDERVSAAATSSASSSSS